MTSGALRATLEPETSIAPVVAKVPRSGRSRTTEARRVPHAEIARIAAEAELPPGVTDICMTTSHEYGSVLSNGDWSGLGGHTQFGPAWVTHGRVRTDPIALFDRQEDARELYALLAGEEGELWAKKQRRLAAIAAAEAAEAAAEADAKTARASSEKTKKRAQRRGDGDGWSQPSSSSAKRTASSGRGMSRRDRLRRA